MKTEILHQKKMAHNLEDLMTALFDFSISNGSSSTEFADAAMCSLSTLGCKQPKIFLNSVHAFFLQRGDKLKEKGKSFIFRCLANVLNEGRVLDECEEQQVLLIINLTTQEMSMAKDTENGLANSAKEVLVNLAGRCNRYVNHVVDSLLSKFQPGSSSPPHRFIILTLSEIAQNNATGFVPFLTDILARTTHETFLPHVKNDQIRSAFSQAICTFAESVRECAYQQKKKLVEKNQVPDEILDDETEQSFKADDTDIHRDYADQFEIAYDTVINWANSSKDYKCRADAAECVGTLCLMIQKGRVLKDLKKLDGIFRYLHRKAGSVEEQLAITKGIANFLQATCTEENISIEHYINDLFEILFPHVCLLAEYTNGVTDETVVTPNNTQMKIRNEVLRCFQVSSCRSADKEIYFLLHKMQSQTENIKLGAIAVLRHLLNSADDHMKENRSLITMGLKPFLTDELLSVRVKMSLCKLCVALSDHEYLQNDEAGEQVMQFLLTNLVYKLDPTAKRTIQQPGTNENILQSQLNSHCAQALYTISNTSKSAQDLLWPLLFEYVCVEQYSPVIADLFKCLRKLCSRIYDAEHILKPLNLESNLRLPGPTQLMTRLFVFMNGAPVNLTLNTRAKEAILLFSELAIWFNEKFTDRTLISKITKRLLTRLEEDFSCFTTSSIAETNSVKLSNKTPTLKDDDYWGMEFKSTRIQRWQALVLDSLCTLVDTVDDQKWREDLAAAQAKQMNLFTISQPDSQQISHVSDKAFLMRCLGCTLARVQCPNFIRDHLYLLFRQTAHVLTAERVGCAMAVGHCASVLDHTDIVLTELENVSKWEHMREKKVVAGGASAGFLTFIKDSLPYGRAIDAEILNLRATILLSYGYVIFYCPPEGLISRLEKTVFPFLRQYTANMKETLLREAHLETLNLIALSVHPSRIRDYRFESRYECLSYIKEYVNDEKSAETLCSWIRLLASKATAAFVLLDPPLSENEFLDILNVLVQNIFPICREKSGLKTLDLQCILGFSHVFSHKRKHTSTENSLPYTTNACLLSPITNRTFISDSSNKCCKEKITKTNGKGGKGVATKIDDDEASTVMEATVIQCRNVIANMVRMRPTVNPTVNELLKLFYRYYGSDKDHERARAIDFTVVTLKIYSEKATDCKLGVAEEFSPLPSLLARLCPRLCDSLAFVRQQSLWGIWLTFKLSLLHQGHSPLDSDLFDSALFNIKEFIGTYFGGAATHEGRIDSNKCSAIILAISKEVEKRLPQSQVQTYLNILSKMLSDRQGNVSSAAAKLFSTLIYDRANALQQEAGILIESLLDHLGKTHLDKIQTYAELLNGLVQFSSHHLQTAIHVLLKQPLPYDQIISEVCEMLSRIQFANMIDYLLELTRSQNVPTKILSVSSQKQKHVPIGLEADEQTGLDGTSQRNATLQRENLEIDATRSLYLSHFELLNIGGGTVIKVVSSEACALLSCITELIKKGEPEDELTKRIPIVITTLLQMLVSLIDTQYSTAQRNANIDTSANINPSQPISKEKDAKKARHIVTSELTRISDPPVKLVANAIKALLTRINAENVIERMNTERAWSNITNSQQYISTISSFCCALLDFRPNFIAPLMRIETDYLKLGPTNASDAERISAAAVLSALLIKSPHENGEFDSHLFSKAFQSLTDAFLNDPNLLVRKLVVKGIGQIGKLKGPESDELISRFSRPSIEIALAGLDDHGDRQDQLATESIASLDLLVRISKPSLITMVLPQLLLKVRPCFEKENPILRSNSFSLFAGLGLTGGNCEAFRENWHSNIVSILLHLNDEDESVQISCARVLLVCASMINSEHASVLIERELCGEKPPYNYSEFIRQFGIILPLSFPDRLNTYALDCNNYFRSMSARIRSNAVLLMGYMLTSLTSELRATLSKDLIFSGLIQLLKDPENQVRLNTVFAISLLHEFA